MAQTRHCDRSVKLAEIDAGAFDVANGIPKLDVSVYLKLSQVVGNVPGLDASGNVVASGSGHIGNSNFAGPGGVTITHNLNLANYRPHIDLTEVSGAIGEIWITDVAVNSFVVRNSGAGLATFSWIIYEIS
jgi:hypothetical protein